MAAAPTPTRWCHQLHCCVFACFIFEVRFCIGQGGDDGRFFFFYLTFTLQLPDEPRSQVSSLLPPGTRLHFYRAEGSAFPTLVDFHRILLNHDLALSAGFLGMRDSSREGSASLTAPPVTLHYSPWPYIGYGGRKMNMLNPAGFAIDLSHAAYKYEFRRYS